jgi:PAS domain-containing protein/anti-sigma regulatory factor (Ser/Thr protein kinase)
VHRLRKRIPVDGRDLVYDVVSYPMLDGSGEVTGGIELAIDITKTCEAEEAVAERDSLLESVFASIGDEITVLDMDHNIVRFNPTIGRHYAHAMPLAGKKCYEAFQGRDSVCPGCPSEKALLTGETARAEVASKGPTGVIRGWVDIHSFPLVDPATGKTKGVIEHVRDVTDRKMLEGRTADFYAMLTHDLSSPLTAVMGYVELLKSNISCSGDKDAMQLAAGLRDSGLKLKKLMEEYLEISRIEFGKFSLFPVIQDFGDVLSDVRREFEVSAKARDLELGFEVQDGMPMAYIDRKYLHRAVSNLLQNAVKYTPRGGKVLVKAWRSGETGGGPIVLEVTDTGPGIPEDEAPRVFEKYYRSPKVMGSKGTGLGLYIVKTVAEAHGGRVEVESEPGNGSTFRLFIPVKP